MYHQLIAPVNDTGLSLQNVKCLIVGAHIASYKCIELS